MPIYKDHEDMFFCINYQLNKEVVNGLYKKYWGCMACDGHGVIIRDNKLVECEACMGDF